MSDANKLLIRCAWAGTSAFASAGYGPSWGPGSCTLSSYDEGEYDGSYDGLPSPPPPPYTFAVHLTVVSGPCVVSGQCVHSAHYPSDYGDYERCTLQPARGQPLQVEAFNTEQGYDYLTINGVEYSGSGTDYQGNSIPLSIVPDREITWSSDGGVTRSGWLICQESEQPHRPPWPPHMPPSPPSPPSPPALPPHHYTFTTKASLKVAVQAFNANAALAIAQYGPIADWDVSAVSDMSELFEALENFNADISSWNTSGVTTMDSMFKV